MQIEFIGHAGFWLIAGEMQIVVDPWLVPSSFENPVLESFMPDSKTIDYLIPEPVREIKDIQPDFILLSHFHTHHAPKIEIDRWLSSAEKSITLMGPKPQNKDSEQIINLWSSTYPQHKFIFIEFDEGFEFADGLVIEAMTHTTHDHLAYYIRHNNRSFLHIADSIVSKVWHDRRLDHVWQKFRNKRPDLLAITVSSTAYRGVNKEGFHYLRENGFMSPVEAANLTALIQPKNATVMGIFNFSIWRNRTEYGYSSYEVEAYYRWAVQHLTPHIIVHTIRPGNCFGFIQDQMYLTGRPARSDV